MAGDPSAVSLSVTVEEPDTLMMAALCDNLSGDTEMEKMMAGFFIRAWRVWQKRQRKYGRGNIAKHGALGCAVRTSDKMARLDRYYFEGKVEPMTDETMTDSWIDAANYALMGAACFEGRWPGSPETR